MLNGVHRAKSSIGQNNIRGEKRSPGFAPGARGLPWEKASPAQGMVEFAIVLPILLLIIFGIIAFGHFFFNYSLVVAASREAARFGAAVGLTENSIPRYRDCNQIRFAAVQSGKLAGVDGTDATISISYDQGPRTDGTTEVYEDAAGVPVGCPVDGVGPGFIELGDRIVVTVSTMYEPIVPLVNMQAMPLTATTRRTIMLGMPVGEQPIAEASACVGTLTRIIPPNYDNDLLGSTSLVGEPVTFTYEVIADEPDKEAKGKIYFYVDDVLYAMPVCSANAPAGSCERGWFEATDLTADPVKPHVLRARYDPAGYTKTNPCFDPSKAEPLRHFILPADTELTILSIDPSPSEVGEKVTIKVEVRPVAPAGGTPFGPVYIEEKNGGACDFLLNEYQPGVARGSCILELDQEGLTTIAATYDPGDPGANPNYHSSSAAAEHQVGSDPDPNPIDQCPVFAPAVIAQDPNGSLGITVHNRNEFIDIPISNVTLYWPEVDSSFSLAAVSVNNAQTWSAPDYPAPLTPPVSVPLNYTMPGSPPGFPSYTNLVFGFTNSLPSGEYRITVHFGQASPPIECSPITITGKR